MGSLLSLCRSGLSRHPMIGTVGALVLSAATVDAQGFKAYLPSAEPLGAPQGKHMIDKSFVPASLNAQEDVQIMVELEDEPAIKVYSRARQVDHMTEEAARAESEKRVESIKQKHNKLRKKLEKEAIGAKVIFSVMHAYNGIAVLVHPGNVERIRALDGVKAVHGLKPKTRLANNSVDFINAPSFWNTVANGGLNIHGEGIKIGDIDTGLDYIHKNFGGSGSAADYMTAIADRNGATPFFPNSVVAGGYDFAGDAYTAAASGVGSVPMPDPNPFDSPNVSDEGHGTGTASILAGRGVDSDGSEFPGPYDSNVPLASQIVGPGVAPGAQLYAYRVFGNSGSTNLVVQAVDQGVQDKVNILSLSLGADFGSADDPDAVALDNASEAGIICVAAAGNAGDTYYITGDPAASTRDISVAASYNDNYLIPTLTGVAPSAIAGKTFAFTSGSAGPTVTTAIPAQDVVYALPHIGLAQNSDGTFPNLTNAASIKGHIALIDRGTYSFYIKVAECQQAGATAVIIANNQAGTIVPATSGPATGPLAPNGTYTPTIPNGSILQADGNTIKATLDGTNGTDTGTQLSFTAQNGADTLPSYTSRGPRRPDGLLKPDVTAPAEAVDVAKNTTGTGIQSFNGTSSATPHVAGTMALLKQLHPTWTVEQLKALIMNTADHDLFVNIGESGTKVGPGRIGNGRIDLTPASTASVIAYNADGSGAVSVSYGPVDVAIDGGVKTYVKTINVVNKSTTAQSFNTSFASVGTDVPGVTFAVAPATVAVPAATSSADGVAQVTVTMTADPTMMTHTHDPSIATTQGGSVRDYKSEATGYVQLTPTAISGTPIRLVVHAMPRPASTAHVASTALSLPGTTGTVNIPFTGTAVETAGSPPTAIFSLLKMMELQYVGTGAFNDGTYDDTANLQYVGISSDYAARGNALASTVFQFGIVSYADHAGPDAFNTEFDVNIDTTGGSTFTPNYTIYNFLLGTSPNYENIYAPFIVNLATGAASTKYVTDAYSGPNGLDTNIFNTNVLTYPIAASSLGMTASSNPVIHYQVVGFYQGVEESVTPVLTYDPTHPGLVEPSKAEPFFDDDYGSQQAANNELVNLTYSNANILANRSLGALALHFHNASGQRADMLSIAAGVPKITSFTPATGRVGTSVTLTGTGLTGATAVTFFNNVPGTITANTATNITVTVPTGATSGTITVTTPSGKATTTKKFGVTP